MILTCFLGIGQYQSCRQFHHDQPQSCCETPYIQTALAQLATGRGIDLSEIRILATDKAWQTHSQALSDDLQQRDLPAPVRYAIPDGSNEAEFWTIFDQLRLALQGQHVMLDITHGFRAQPFFAAAVVQYLAALDELPAELEMHYGQLSDDRSECLIWDLSPFLSLLQWSTALDGFLRHGKGHALAKLSQQLEADVRRALAKERNQHLIQARHLVNALDHLSDAIATVRVPHIISAAHYEHHGKKTPTAHATEVIKQIDTSQTSIENYMPALAPLLERLQTLLKPLQADTLEGAEGLTAQHALAGQYLRWQRPAEASIVLREASVSRYTNGDPLNKKIRENAEQTWYTSDTHNCQNIADLRNDIQHGGWRKNARQGKSLHSDLEKQHREFDPAPAQIMLAQTPGTAAQTTAAKARTLFVTRHPGALTWLHKQGHDNAELCEHLNQSTIQTLTPEDTIIGTLPIHLAAQVCQKKACFIFLQMDIPKKLRGKELSCEDMAQCNARLEPYHIQSTA